MQIKSMPTSTTLFKSKFSSFIQKISPQPSQDSSRRDSTASTSTENISRKYSDAMSVGTFESNITIADKFRQVFPNIFRRRSSSAISHNENDYDYYKELEKLQALYLLAIDELNYAEDSQGSTYYSGDLEAAREAVNDCANSFIQLLEHTLDPTTREGLETSMSPKLFKLQKRLSSLPDED